MVDSCKAPAGGGWRFVLRPNCSLSWRGNILFFLGLFVVSMTVAVALAFMGLWLVLPFAGLEMAALAWALYVVGRKCHWREVISVNAGNVVIERGWDRPVEVECLPRSWARVELRTARSSWYPSRLMIRAMGRSEEVGRFLNEDERVELAMGLQQALRT